MQETEEMWLDPQVGNSDSPGVGNSDPPQYFCLENPIDRGAWWATVHGVTGVGQLSVIQE